MAESLAFKGKMVWFGLVLFCLARLLLLSLLG